MSIALIDARRLTGLNLDLPGPGALAEIDFGDDAARTAGIARIRAALAVLWPEARPVVRMWPDGRRASFAFEAPIDRLYAGVNLLERLVLHLAEDSDKPWDHEALRASLTADLEAEAAPLLLHLQQEAEWHDAPFLWDDDEVSLGFGASARIWPAKELPARADIEAFDWNDFRDMPKVLITGTNGKTTTSRMTARILAAAGHVVGATSTDALMVAGEIIERGDWTGPGAARRILRDARVTAAVLETARGGMLRRGLGVVGVDAAVVTNVGADHLGEHGIGDVAAMAAVKAVVWRAAKAGARRIVNAQCDASFEAALAVGPVYGDELDPESWVMFAREDAHPRVAAHREQGGETWTCKDGAIVRTRGGVAETVVELGAIPATWRGLAGHNVDNALAAAATAGAAGIDAVHIAAGLAGFGADPDDNPGRAELWRVGALRLLLDFGHNAHGIEAVAPLIGSLRVGGARLSVAIGQAGDRTDADLEALVAAVMALRPDRVLVRALPGYERGRAPGEVEGLLEAAFRRQGGISLVVQQVASESEALDVALRDASEGDLAVHFVHIERTAVRERLAELGAVAGG
jgi:cyanophycin synthetase